YTCWRYNTYHPHPSSSSFTSSFIAAHSTPYHTVLSFRLQIPIINNKSNVVFALNRRKLIILEAVAMVIQRYYYHRLVVIQNVFGYYLMLVLPLTIKTLKV